MSINIVQGANFVAEKFGEVKIKKFKVKLGLARLILKKDLCLQERNLLV